MVLLEHAVRAPAASPGGRRPGRVAPPYSAELGPDELRTVEPGAAQIRLEKQGANEPRPREVGAAQVREIELSVDEQGTGQLGPGQVGTEQRRQSQSGPGHPDPAQLREVLWTGDHRAGQIGVPKI